jgi:hypothetical protein
MNATTKKIKLPISGIEIEIKDWVNAQEAEYIDDALYAGIDIKTENGKPKIGKFNSSVINEQTHREIEKFVIAIGAIKENILKEVLTLSEVDYEFIKDAIKERRPKKKLEGIELI